MSEYQFTNAWFSPLVQSVWNMIVPMDAPKRFLEIGSFEGRSTTWFINKFARQWDIEVHCIDSWAGCSDNALMEVDFNASENRFKHNMELATKNNPFKTDLHVHKGTSESELIRLCANGYLNYFDVIYVDANHEAAECLSDAVLAWKLLKMHGLMIFDDYIFAVPNRPRWDVPKTAIDAFLNIHCNDAHLINAPNQQVYVKKIKEGDLVWAHKAPEKVTG